jgi:hypothetical protein
VSDVTNNGNAPEPPRVGGDTMAWCTTCRAVGEHVIVAMVGIRPAKVECASCHKQHLYRAAAPGTLTAASTKTGARRKSVPPPDPAPEPVDLEALVAGRPRKPYDTKSRYAIGEVVDHPSFGVGLVTLLPGPQRVEIAFQVGAKLLTHDRGASSTPALVRPPRRDDEAGPTVSDAPPDRPKSERPPG